MRPDDVRHFDDPVLKSAVKKAYASESAPVALRQRVAGLLSEPVAVTPGDAGGPLSIRRRNPLYGLAAAAILLLAIGVAISQYAGWIDIGGLPGGGGSAQNTLPITIAESMVAAHESCAKLPDHNLIKSPAGAPTDWSAVRESLRSSMGRPVLVADLGDGWAFQGAGSCSVGRMKSAHLLFTRGEQVVSIFSMPPVAYEVKGDGNYETSLNGHPIAGFATRRGLYCLVATDPAGKLTEQDIAALRDRIRDKLAYADPPPSFPAGAGCHAAHAISMR